MASIPASQIVAVNPSVLSAGGTGLTFNGLVLTQNTRIPYGSVLSFPTLASVGAYFGLASNEYAIATNYFAGFSGAITLPGALLFNQYPWQAPVAAYVRGAPLVGFTVATLQAITNGAITVVSDGGTYSATGVSLATATSFSAAAALIQTALNASEPSEATFTGAIATGSASVTGTITGEVMNVTAVSSGTLVIGATISGTGVTSGTQILSQLTGATGGIGTYQVSAAQTVASETLTAAYGTLTVSTVASGTLTIGQIVTGTSVAASTQIMSYGTGTGLTGTYIVNNSQTVASESLVASGNALNVTYDTISNAFVITTATTGTAATIAYPSGTLATSLNLTSALGAALSQGAAITTPAAAMAAVVAQTQNWCLFMTAFEPVVADKIAFAAWNNSQNNRYGYVCWDSDITPTLSTAATASAGYQIGVNGANYSGTCMVYLSMAVAAFILGTAASLDFAEVNGRQTFAFREQTGLYPTVTNAVVAANLIANGYNFYGTYATAAQPFTWLYPGQVSGPFAWLDSFVNQIWMNNAFQLALMTLLQSAGSIPYNQAGYAMMAQALADPINAAVNYGAIRQGVTLSSTQKAIVNASVGKVIDPTLSAQGWYLSITDPGPQARAARTTPVCLFYYMDGQSVQQITLGSIELQ